MPYLKTYPASDVDQVLMPDSTSMYCHVSHCALETSGWQLQLPLAPAHRIVCLKWTRLADGVCVTCSLSKGADGTLQDADGETALHKASFRVCTSVAKLHPPNHAHSSRELRIRPHVHSFSLHARNQREFYPENFSIVDIYDAWSPQSASLDVHSTIVGALANSSEIRCYI